MFIQYSIEECNDFQSENFGCPEALRVQHDLRDELPVRLGHGKDGKNNRKERNKLYSHVKEI